MSGINSASRSGWKETSELNPTFVLFLFVKLSFVYGIVCATANDLSARLNVRYTLTILMKQT